MLLHPLLARALRRHRLKRFFNSSRIHAQRLRPLHPQRQKRRDPPAPSGSDHRAPQHSHGSRARPVASSHHRIRPQRQSRQGWELMPQSLRHQYLIDIFRSRYPETRLLHLENALREAAQHTARYAGNTTDPNLARDVALLRLTFFR